MASVNNYGIKRITIAQNGTGGSDPNVVGWDDGVFNPVITYRSTSHVPDWTGAITAKTLTPNVDAASLSAGDVYLDVVEWAVSAMTFNNVGVTNVSDIPKNLFIMSNMFRYGAEANPDTQNWDVSRVVSTSHMFRDATSANPNVSTWDVSSVENMEFMFRGATLANPDLSAWDFSAVTDMTNMFLNSGLDTANYDKLLIALGSQTVNDGVPLGVGSTKYTAGGAAEAARDALLFKGWVITDGGPV